VLFVLFERIWQGKQIPDDWRRELIVKIPKTGDTTECTNWEGNNSLIYGVYSVHQNHPHKNSPNSGQSPNKGDPCLLSSSGAHLSVETTRLSNNPRKFGLTINSRKIKMDEQWLQAKLPSKTRWIGDREIRPAVPPWQCD